MRTGVFSIIVSIGELNYCGLQHLSAYSLRSGFMTKAARSAAALS